RLERFGDAADDRVLEGKDGLVDGALLQGVEHLLEAGERNRDGAVRGRRHLAERARLALVADLQIGRAVGCSIFGLAVGDLAQQGWLLERGHSTPTSRPGAYFPAGSGSALFGWAGAWNADPRPRREESAEPGLARS